MKEKVISTRNLSRGELGVLLVALVSVGVATGVTAGSSWLLAGIFETLAPLLFVSVPGYFLVTYTNRNKDKFKRFRLRLALAAIGAAMIVIGVIGTLFSLFTPWVAWILIGVALYYFYNR